jgi:hypothetical protein
VTDTSLQPNKDALNSQALVTTQRAWPIIYEYNDLLAAPQPSQCVFSSFKSSDAFPGQTVEQKKCVVQIHIVLLIFTANENSSPFKEPKLPRFTINELLSIVQITDIMGYFWFQTRGSSADVRTFDKLGLEDQQTGTQ